MNDRNVSQILESEFRQAMSLDTFRSVVSSRTGAGAPGGELKRIAETVMQPAVVSFVKGLVEAGRFSSIPNAEGHKIRLVDAWNDVANGDFGTKWDPVFKLKVVAESLVWDWLFEPAYATEKKVSSGADFDAVTAEAYEGMVANVVAGDRTGRSVDRDHTCTVEDHRYALKMSGWQPYLERFDMVTHAHVPMVPIAPIPLRHFQIEFPTGDLIVDDRIDMEEFAALVGPRNYARPALGSTVGSEMETMDYLTRLGVIHISVDNTSPDVLVDGDDVVVGSLDYDYPEAGRFTKMGEVDTYIWWTTIVDRSRLADIVSEGSGVSREEALVKIAAYVEEKDLSEIRVKPGVKHVYYSGDREKFVREFHSDDFKIPETIDPFFVISDRELVLSTKPDPVNSPKI